MVENIKRIKFLDGFRGLAILLVVLFHAYSGWSNVVPYGKEFSWFPVFQMGWLGVQLFFLISGFVILMTLERCSNFGEFISRRWVRLFPAMLIATVLIYFSAPLLPERPAGIPRLVDVLPGLFFIEPTWIGAVHGVPQAALEGSFWSLFVEVKFYVIFGLLYFYLGERKAIGSIFAIFMFAMVVKMIKQIFVNQYLLDLNGVLNELSLEHFGWFASGSFMFLCYKHKDNKLLVYAILIGLLSAVSVAIIHGKSMSVLLGATALLIVFIVTVYFDNMKYLFEGRALIYLGIISYPFYLIHENAMIALIVKTGAWSNAIPNILLPVLPLVILVTIAQIITKYCEPGLSKIIKHTLNLRKS